jgi:hypothetical protein
LSKPAILITIDTEGDNLWAGPREITTRNAEYLPRFQELCEKHGFRPTYLTNWEMVTSPAFVEFGRAVLQKGTAEIGTHIHAWNTPPVEPISDDDFAHRTYLTDYAPRQMREKVKVITAELESAFQTKMYSHRGGRWAMNETLARILVEHGYLVETSVTPHLSWRSHTGVPGGEGGPDYTRFPEDAYFMDLDAFGRPGASALLEIPITVLRRRWPFPVEALRRISRWHPRAGRAMDRFFPAVRWFRPKGYNRREMLTILEIILGDGRDYVHFMLHSSEFMPGGSPTFPTKESIESLYDDMEAVFSAAARDFEGLTLKEYYDRFSAGKTGRSRQG